MTVLVTRHGLHHDGRRRPVSPYRRRRFESDFPIRRQYHVFVVRGDQDGSRGYVLPRATDVDIQKAFIVKPAGQSLAEAFG